MAANQANSVGLMNKNGKFIPSSASCYAEGVSFRGSDGITKTPRGGS